MCIFPNQPFAGSLQVLGRARVVPGNGTVMLRGVFMLGGEDDLSGSATVYVETPHPSMTLSMDTPKVYLASDLSDKSVVSSLPANLSDVYSPCTVIDDHGYSGVWEVELPGNSSGGSDTLNIEMCSPGGYDQVRRRLACCLSPACLFAKSSGKQVQKSLLSLYGSAKPGTSYSI